MGFQASSRPDSGPGPQGKGNKGKLTIFFLEVLPQFELFLLNLIICIAPPGYGHFLLHGIMRGLPVQPKSQPYLHLVWQG
jgi:hypothetical protein